MQRDSNGRLWPRLMKRSEMRGKWARDPWIRILELLSKMPRHERQRCIRATAQFIEGWK